LTKRGVTPLVLIAGLTLSPIPVVAGNTVTGTGLSALARLVDGNVCSL